MFLGVFAASAAFASGSSESTGPTTLTMWTGYSERLPVYNAAIADYTKEHPNVKIEISSFDLRQSEQKLQIALAAGTAPDVSGLGFQLMQRLAAENYFEPLPAADVSWINQNYDKVYVDAVTRDGKIYAIPEVQGQQLLFYNIDNYNAAGISGPPTTLDGLMSDAQKLTKYDANGKVTHSGISFRLTGGGSGVAEKWQIFLFANGGRILEPTGPHTWKAGFDNEAGYNAVNFYLTGLYKTKIDSFDVKHDEDAFVNGITSQFNRETYIIGSMRTKAPNTQYGISQVVGGPGGRGTNLNIDTFVVPASGKNKAVAWDFAKYLEQDKYAVMMMDKVGWTVSKKGVDYSSVYAKEPHFKQALDRPAGFKLFPSAAAVSWGEAYTGLANGLVSVFSDPTMLDNKAKIMAFLDAQAKAVNDVLKSNNEYAQ
jgi:multiple sugar transport system substrate-binding protein